jgi:hypothetical protein
MVKNKQHHRKDRHDWPPQSLGNGFHDLAIAAAPELTAEGFGAMLRQYLRERDASLSLDGRLIGRLYRNTYWCRQQLEALRKIRKVIQSKDWNKREALLRSLPKKLNSFEEKLGKYRNVKFPLRDELVRSVIARIIPFNKSLKHDLLLATRVNANEKTLLSGFLKPTLESQYMLDVYNVLKNRLHSLNVEKRILIVAGCIHAGKILPHRKDEQDLHDLINMRIHRARKAYKEQSAEWRWGLTDNSI